MTIDEIKQRSSLVSQYLVDSGLKRESDEWRWGMCMTIARLLVEHAGYRHGPIDEATAELGRLAREVLDGI